MTTGPAPITGKDWQNHVEPRIMAEDLRALEQAIQQALDSGGDVGQAVEDYLAANPPAAVADHDHTAADIDSGAATDGHVLTADGAGGAAWEAPPAGGGGGGTGYPVQHIALTSAYTLTPTGWPAETVVTVVFTQDSTGGRTVEFAGNALNVNAEPHARTVAQFFPLGDGTYLVSYPGTTFHRNADGTFTITGPAVVEPVIPPLAVIAADTFTRADNPTTLGVTEVGSKTWVAENSTWGIKSNAARMYSGTAVRGHVNIDAGTPDMRVTATKKGMTVEATYPALVARYSSQGSYYSYTAASHPTQPIKQSLTRRDGDTSTTLVEISATEAPDGAVMSLSVQEVANGTRLICTLDGVEVANYLDQSSNRPTGTKCGFFSYSPSTISWDDFTVEEL